MVMVLVVMMAVVVMLVMIQRLLLVLNLDAIMLVMLEMTIMLVLAVMLVLSFNLCFARQFLGICTCCTVDYHRVTSRPIVRISAAGLDVMSSHQLVILIHISQILLLLLRL